MRRWTVPCVRSTNPVRSLSAALRVTETRTAKEPGTVTDAGTDTVTPCSCAPTDAAQAPAPPPASESLTVRAARPPRRRKPNERSVGAAKIFGSSARGRSMTPPPSRAGETSVVRWLVVNAGSPVRTSADLSCATVHDGCRSRRSAAPPATCGEAMLVPLRSAHRPRGCAERTLTPGAATSGLNWSETGVGPAEEKSATTSGGELRGLVTAAAVIARGAFPGEVTEPKPKSSKSLPAAIAETTPAAAAASTARTTMSRRGSIAGSPKDMFSTSMPSRTAASIPATISGELPSGPTAGVGTPSTL